MFYLSQLLGMPIEDLNGQRLGKISDVLIQPNGLEQVGSTLNREATAYPSALLIEGQDDQDWRVPIDGLQWQGNVLQLRVPVEQLTRQPALFRRGGSGEDVGRGPLWSPASPLSLAHDILDKQVIDIVRKKAVRVNDVCLGDDWQILGIDNSTLGLVRRLAPSWLLGTNIRRSPTNLIPWDHVELIGTHQPEEETESSAEAAGGTVQTRWGMLSHMTRTPSGHLAELHPADIADIVHQLTPEQGARLLEGMDDETAADALEEVDTESQTHILENMSTDRAVEILQAMGPDEAADLLAKLPEERAQELLALMNPEESEDVQDLLKYEENSAGGLMTTDYIALDTTKTVADALDAVRTNIQEQDVRTAYVYCVADASQDDLLLQGVVSLWDLLVAPLIQPLQELMETDIISVRPETDPHTVAEIMAKYNLLAVPVVSEQGFLAGIVTVDDALDVLLPAGRRRKPTRMY
jgi:CBS domain-containing protein/sporulation protein YlmC with PRC-barrel domain